MNIIAKVAEQYKTTPDEVREEMTFAIKEGFNSPDPRVQAIWKKLFPDGKKPTPEQLIAVLAREVKS